MIAINKWLHKILSGSELGSGYVLGDQINLLVELDTFDKGGLQKMVLDTLTEFNRKLFDITIVSINGSGYLADIAKSKGFDVFGLTGPSKAQQYENIITSNKINLSCSHFSHFGYKLLDKYNIPNITFIHNVYAFLNDKQVKLFQASDQYVQKYVSVSRKCSLYASQVLGIAENKIVTVPNGLNIEEHIERHKKAITLSRSDFQLDANDYVFLNVASYNLHKGHYLMADAMKRILSVRDDIKILCIGNVIYPPHIDCFREFLTSEGLNRHILMPGYFPNVEAFHKMCDAFLLPSLFEGWSIAMNEAMFYGKPMILTDTGGASDVIIDNDIGIIIPTEYHSLLDLHSEQLDRLAYETREFRTAPLLAEAMIAMADNRDYWAIAGKMARKKIVEDFNIKNIIKRYEQTLLDVMKERHPQDN